MQPLRSARFLARLVLAWFVLVVGFAAAAPIAQPQSLDVICSGGMMKLVVTGDADDGAAPATVSLDCPLCMVVAPPPVAANIAEPQPLGRILRGIPAARLAALTAKVPPARGPPARFA